MGLNYKDKETLQRAFSVGFTTFLETERLKTQDVAKALGVTDSAVSSWKYGRAFPDVPNLFRLIELGFSLNSCLPIELEIKNKINSYKNEIEKTKKSIQSFSELLKITKGENAQKEIREQIKIASEWVLELQKRIEIELEMGKRITNI